MMNYKSHRGKWLVALIDPVWVAPAVTRLRLLQSETKYLSYAALIHFVGWPIIWIIAAILNDSGKPNSESWLRYRLFSVSIMVFLGVVCALFRNRPSFVGISLILLAALQTYAYSWAMHFGTPVREKWIVLFPTIILMTSFRSLAVNSISLLLIVSSSMPWWAPYARKVWVFTEAEVAFILMIFSHLIWRISLENRINRIIYEDLRRESDLQRATFFKQIVSFISPAFFKQIENAIIKYDNPVAAIHSVLQRRKAQVSVLYSDIRGFSDRADNSDFIEKELIPSSATIIDESESNLGVAKQIGDAVLVYYALDDPEESLLRASRDAVRCCMSEFQRICNLGRTLPERHFVVTFGEALVGNMASANHREATIIGYPANLAQRIDEFSKKSKINHLIQLKPTIIFSDTAGSLFQTFGPFDLTEIKVDLVEEGIRSFPNEKKIYLFTLSKNNLANLKDLLRLNKFPGLEELSESNYVLEVA